MKKVHWADGFNLEALDDDDNNKSPRLIDGDDNSSVGSKDSDTEVSYHANTGRPVRTTAGIPPERLIETMNLELEWEMPYNLGTEPKYQLNGIDIGLVGAGTGGGFGNTVKLKVLNYREAMRSPDKEEWEYEIANEKDRFDKFNVVTVVKPQDAKIFTTTWAMKKKSNGTRRGRLNA